MEVIRCEFFLPRSQASTRQRDGRTRITTSSLLDLTLASPTPSVRVLWSVSHAPKDPFRDWKMAPEPLTFCLGQGKNFATEG